MAAPSYNSKSTLFLFGPQITSFSKESFQQLRSAISDGVTRHWALDTVAELPTHWDAITTTLPTLKNIPGKKQLQDLHSWLRNGLDHDAEFDLPNIILTPLVVITQLIQYAQFLSLSHSGRDDDVHAYYIRPEVETLGFCTGLLSAIAVASSATMGELETHGAVAIRLAMLIGAVVDAQEDAYGRAKSFAIAWYSSEQRQQMTRIVDQFPGAYIPVKYDRTRVTVTTSNHTAPLLLQKLKATGITIAETGLRGRFHCQEHERNMYTILRLCNKLPGFQFPDADDLVLHSSLNGNGESLQNGRMHYLVVNSILVERCNWYDTLVAVHTSRLNSHQDSHIVSFGPERFIPASLTRKLGPQMVHFAQVEEDTRRSNTKSQNKPGKIAGEERFRRPSFASSPENSGKALQQGVEEELAVG